VGFPCRVERSGELVGTTHAKDMHFESESAGRRLGHVRLRRMRLGRERRNKQANSENGREPDQPHEHLGVGCRAEV